MTKSSMNKEVALQYLGNTMSLRAPQVKSLTLFAEYLESPAGQQLLARMKRENRGDLNGLEAASKAHAQIIAEFSRFEAFGRTFPAYTFALATGVGKTRLMGAFVAYLYLVHGVQHFLIVAPGNTIYRKLVDDFSRASNPKYVFRGIEEININTTRIITKDNFELNSATAQLFGNQLQINIFNVQQFAQKDMEKEKGITKFSETLGESYFEYLKSLDDLVVLMDESHHYHAEAAMGSLDLIDPLFGLEFTATPYTGNMTGRGKDKKPEFKKNIAYTYNLGDAIRDGYVKDPWVGTEADVDFSQWDAESIETDARKLQLAAYFHERAKVALKEYALENDKPEVKPVMLVVAKDTAHAGALRALIDGDNFRVGAYKGKVLEIHSKTRGDEADETIEKLISLENPDNIVEIVIHVNMLKEGWDVANIYTIAPIRSSASEILTEQTIGRGLRLPYGERTGVKNIDRVMIVAHEKYAKVVEAARLSTLIQPSNIESVSTAETKVVKEIITVSPVVVASLEEKIKASPAIMKEIAEQAERTVGTAIPQETPAEVRQETIKHKTEEIVASLARQEVAKSRKTGEEVAFEEGSLFNPFSDAAKKELEEIARFTGEVGEVRNIPIPRMILEPHFEELLIRDFDLDTNRLSRYASEASILEERLQATEQRDLFGNVHQAGRESVITKVSSFGEGSAQSPENTIISGVTEFPLVDYDDKNQQPLLLKLAGQAVSFYRKYAKDENALKMVVENNFRQISQEIYDQVLEHREFIKPGFIEPSIGNPRAMLEPVNLSKAHDERPVTFDSQYDRLPSDKIYTGFRKACHPMYRFDVVPEVKFAYLLDRDSTVRCWLYPAPKQFEGLYYRNKAGDTDSRYEPDFVVELDGEIVIAELKNEEEIGDADVQSKKETAEKFCEIATKNIGKFGIAKPWRYIIIPSDKVTLTSTASGLLMP